MDELGTVWILVTIAIVVIGPGGGAYVLIRGFIRRIEDKFSSVEDAFSIFVEQMKLDREETREWLKDMQLETSKNTTDIAVLEALQKED